MARPKNDQERERIRRSAFHLFSEQGIEASSFADIAKSSFVSKSMVQYYFPKKEKFITEFVQRSIDCVRSIAEQLPGFEERTPLEKLVGIAYLQFYFAMYNDKMDRLSREILRDRLLTKMVIDQAIQYNIGSLGEELAGENTEPIQKALKFLYGGALDYIYDCLVDGVEIDIKEVIQFGLTLIDAAVDQPISTDIFENALLDREWLELETRRYNEAMFSV